MADNRWNRGSVATVVTTALASWCCAGPIGAAVPGFGHVRHVLLLSIDGMHAVDLRNCVEGIDGVNNGLPYCPNLAGLGHHAINYVNASSSKPSDSFPGLAALVSGGSPKSTGLYYDVAYDRTLDAPAATTGTGLAGGTCTPYAAPTGTTTDYDQGIDFDDTALNGGAPGAAVTEGGIASIDPQHLVRDPKVGCAPVFPWNFIRVNTIFSVVHAAGGYTAWIDKHPSYSMSAGPGGQGLNDYYSPEVSSNAIALPGIVTAQGIACSPLRDTANAPSAWNASFANIQCYDQLRVNALLNEIAGKTHNGAPAQKPAVFGMNFQSVYIGQSVSEPGVGNGGYQNAAGLAAGANTPATLLGTAIPFSESPLNATGIGATEDDVSVLWLAPGASVSDAVTLLENNATAIGMGEIFFGPSLAVNFAVGGTGPGQDPRAPDIIVTPNIGVTYSGSTSMIGDHGGFAHDDTNVLMLVAHPRFTAHTVSDSATTMQVAPTIVRALGLDPAALDAVRAEGTSVLPEVVAELSR
jgi:hypothetical protein